MSRHSALAYLVKDGPEHRAIEAGEIDAIIDHANSNVILLPAARRALREAAANPTAANCVLGALPRAEYQRLVADLEPVLLKFGEVLQEPGAPITHAYFPIDCVVSLLTVVEHHHALEVGLVGREGMVGISLALGIDISSVRAVVQAPGNAMRVGAARFHQIFQRSLPLRLELYRYTDAKLAQARQAAACLRFHDSEARLARWLLVASDRIKSDRILITQEILGKILGVRRSTVSVAAHPLQRQGLIAYARGAIRILDRKGLETAACECYRKME